MISKNNSYFDRELCLNGHYIVTGKTNDQFCNDMLQLTDIRFELQRYLREKEKFEAVFFLDSSNILYCYDEQSYSILRNNRRPSDEPRTAISAGKRSIARDIESSGPLGRRRRQRNQTPADPAPEHREELRGSLRMGRRLPAAWQQIIAVMQNPELRCALVLNNVNSLQHSLQNPEMSMLEELQSYHQGNHSIVIYLFRDTSISNVLDSANHGTGQWATYVETTLRPRIDTDDPTLNREISLGTPNRYEVRNLLSYMRLKAENRLRIRQQDIGALAQILAASCARQKWSLANLFTRLEVFSSDHGNTVLSVENWREFTGELNYVSPMEQLNRLVGMESVKEDIRNWYALQMRSTSRRRMVTTESSRFAPQVRLDSHVGQSLNVRIVGSQGTGKTTLAKLFGQLYYELGLLPQGHVVVCSSADLVSGYVGDTARIVRERVQEAMGGVLFIDEAYALASGAHGREAVDQLVNDMSAYQGQFAVIIAGYPSGINRLLEVNDGLARRFPTEYVLEDYSAEEIEQIFRLMLRNDSEDITISPSLEGKLHDFFETWVGGRTSKWRNAGEVEVLLTNMKKACSARIAAEKNSDGKMVFTEVDIPENLRHCLAPRSKNLEEAMQAIDQMIGLGNVKVFLRDLVNNIQWGAADRVPGNYIFSGPPGTGKTTVARKIGEILGHMNILRRKVNNVVEVRAADLLNGSKTLVKEVENARGGILFIDEAHQLEQGGEQGHAIIRELVPIVEDPEIRADTCFICAGYPAPMRRFLEVDAGLARRFPVTNRIRFNDYTADELVQILKSMVQARGERIDAGCGYLIRSRMALERYLEQRPSDFGNGGFIRDVYLPESIKARTARLNRKATGDPTQYVSKEKVAEFSEEEKHTLTAEDIPASFEVFAGPVGMKPKAARNADTLLEELIGKDEVVRFVRNKKKKNEPQMFYDAVSSTSLHCAFAGPVGSGRHTAIRAMAAAWRQYGFLERDDVQFVGKGDLEAGFVGQTSLKTQEVIERTLGGTLVVEYPSSMLQNDPSDHSYGPDALRSIIGAMNIHKDELCVVFLDSKEGIEATLQAFPVLRSQLAHVFELEDLMPGEMEQLFYMKTRDSLKFEMNVKRLLPDFFLNWVSDRGGLGEAVRTWGNGIEVDHLVDSLITNWKNMNGKTVSETVLEDGTSYTVNRREITREMFPQKYRKYFTTSRVIAQDALNELKMMTGLQGVKRSVETIERRMRRMSGRNVTPGCYCFLGNPGTGKTTVAKIMGGILKATGTLSQGHVIIRTARQMCEAPDQFDDVIRLARNGILFIDEAHQFLQYGGAGNIVVKRLLTVLEDVSVMKDTCIILAGYPADMLRMLRMDDGLKSRFGMENSMIYFEDYSPEELLSILREMAEKADRISQIGSDYPLLLTREYQQNALQIFREICRQHDPNFGNARFVRNFLHDSIDAQLFRIDEEYGSEDEPSEEAMRTLTGTDIPRRYSRMTFIQKRNAEISSNFLGREEVFPIREDNYDQRCRQLSESVVLLEIYRQGQRQGTGSGTIVTTDGYILTCAHVVEHMDEIRARVFCPGAVGGDYRWFQCEICEPICRDCDMAILKMNGKNFHPMPLRPEESAISSAETTIILGYPLGGMLNGSDMDRIQISNFSGRVASAQECNGITRYYIDSTGLHGNSGSPVISTEDGRMIGIFSGSIVPKGERNRDELNYFYPIFYFWERYVR